MINEVGLRRVIEGSVEPFEQKLVPTPNPAPAAAPEPPQQPQPEPDTKTAEIPIPKEESTTKSGRAGTGKGTREGGFSQAIMGTVSAREEEYASTACRSNTKRKRTAASKIRRTSHSSLDAVPEKARGRFSQSNRPNPGNHADSSTSDKTTGQSCSATPSQYVDSSDAKPRIRC